MTKQQFEKLKQHKGIYDLYMQVQTVNGAHPSMAAISEVYHELTAEYINLSCGDCIGNSLTRIYNEYLRVEQSNIY